MKEENMSTPSVKEQIEIVLMELIGAPIRKFRRVALMLGVDIGDDIIHEATDKSKRIVAMN